MALVGDLNVGEPLRLRPLPEPLGRAALLAREHHDRRQPPSVERSGVVDKQQFRKTLTGFFQEVPSPSAGVVGAGWIAVFLPKQLL